jgi:hypothetical protein
VAKFTSGNISAKAYTDSPAGICISETSEPVSLESEVNDQKVACSDSNPQKS